MIDTNWLSDLEKQANAAITRLRTYVESGLVEPHKVDIPPGPIQLSTEADQLGSWQWVIRWILTARHGADMIDAYMFGHICQNNYVSEEARDGGLEPPKGFDDLSTKRLTSRDESGLKILNCYV